VGFLRRSSLRRRRSEQGRCGLIVRLVGLEGILSGWWFVEEKCSSLVVVRVVELMRCGVAVCFVEVLGDGVV
jgi:hypothetical protein